jgi:hypothetical protein
MTGKALSYGENYFVEACGTSVTVGTKKKEPGGFPRCAWNRISSIRLALVLIGFSPSSLSGLRLDNGSAAQMLP